MSVQRVPLSEWAREVTEATDEDADAQAREQLMQHARAVSMLHQLSIEAVYAGKAWVTIQVAGGGPLGEFVVSNTIRLRNQIGPAPVERYTQRGDRLPIRDDDREPW